MYPDLFALIGTTYGAGDGSTTFNLPNLADNKFTEGSTTAGTVKTAGLPNITGAEITLSPSGVLEAGRTFTNGAFTQITNNTKSNVTTGGSGTTFVQLKLDASNSSSIYGNSTTVQPYSLTVRYIIKAFDGQTADSALIDITQYAQELAGKANITGSNLVHHKDVITTSGTYTAPVQGLYKITVKGGGGGGAGGYYTSSVCYGGAGGGEGGTTIAYEKLDAGDTATVVVGAGGAGGAAQSGAGSNGGNSTVTVNSTTYTGGGGKGGYGNGTGGSGSIIGMAGGPTIKTAVPSAQGAQFGSNGGGQNGGSAYSAALNGGGGVGGQGWTGNSSSAGGAGGDGYVWFEYTSSV
jgi:hypothetical protein